MLRTLRRLAPLLALLAAGCSEASPTASMEDASAPQTPDAGGVADAAPAEDASQDAAPLPVVYGSSKGSGGITCTTTVDLGGGRSYCKAKISGVELRFASAPAAATGPSRLVIYVHGDGARAYTSDGAMKALLPWADAHQARVLAVLAPNGCAWWQTPTHDCATTTEEPDTGANATAFEAVLQALRGGYDIADGPTFYYGSSGGSIFLSKLFFPRFGKTYPGAYAMNCGGEVPPASAYSWDPKDARSRGETKFWFTYGDQDFLKDAAHATAGYFLSLGFPTDEKIIPGATHCAFDAHGRSKEVFSAYLGE